MFEKSSLCRRTISNSYEIFGSRVTVRSRLVPVTLRRSFDEFKTSHMSLFILIPAPFRLSQPRPRIFYAKMRPFHESFPFHGCSLQMSHALSLFPPLLHLLDIKTYYVAFSGASFLSISIAFPDFLNIPLDHTGATYTIRFSSKT